MVGTLFGDVVDKFLVRCEERGLQPATLKSYRYFANSFLASEFGHIEVGALRIRDFEDLYSCMTRVGYHWSTVKKCHTLAGGILQYAEREELVTRNVARLAETPEAQEVERDIPTPEQLVRFLDYCRERDRTIHDFAWIMANTGMRPGEACALAQTDLASDNNLTIQHSLDVSTGEARIKCTKTKKTRRIVVDEETAGIIRSRGGVYVLGGDAPFRSDIASKRWHRLAERISLSFTPRLCRHFHATQLIAAGHTLKDVADRLGHSNPTITGAVYIQSVKAHDTLLSASVGDVLRGVRA